jgi:putative ABC transport system permease protein
MESTIRDVLFAFRSLRRQPAFAITAVLTIALGIGATSAIFSVVNAVLLRPLPYTDAARLGTVFEDLRQRNVVDFPLPPGDYYDLKKDTTQFDDFAAITSFRQAIGGDDRGDAEQVQSAAVTTNFFKILGQRIQLGRDFVDDDGTPPPPPPGSPDALQLTAPPAPLPNIAIISHELWQRRYGSDPSIVDKSIDFGNGKAQVVGVLSPGFEILFPPGTNVDPHPQILIATRQNFQNGSRNNVSLRVIAKVKPGVSFTQAQAELDRLSNDLRSRFAIKQTSNMNLRIEPMHDDLVADVRPQLAALMGAVVFVLLIACANVANLLLVRASARERELAVRAAIGGNRWRIVRQLVIESAVLAVVGGAGGLLLAQFGIDALIQLSPQGLPRATEVSVDGTVLAFTALAALVAALIFGVLPAWKASRPDVMDVLRSSGRLVGGASGRWLRDGAVIAEVALAFVLLVGSGLMIRTFLALQNTNPGFDANNVLTFQIQNNRAQGTLPGRQAFQRTMLEKLQALPGVVDATSVGPLPLDGSNSLARYGSLDAAADPTKFQQASAFFVQPGYFKFARTPIVAGREFTDADNRLEARAIVIDEPIAAQLFPTGNAVGQRMLARAFTPDAEQFEVIGVVKHQRHTTMVNDGEEGMYFPDGNVGFGGAFRWAVRTSGNPEAIVSTVRSALSSQDRRLLMTEPRTWQSFVDEKIAPTRFALILIGVFAGVAAVLAMIGLYGVLATTVRQRQTEIGVRMAFGASAGNILALIIGQGLRLSIGGIVLGVIAAVALTRVMASLLVGVTATDPPTFITMAALFTLTAAFAAWIPARRAAALNPNVALRDE